MKAPWTSRDLRFLSPNVKPAAKRIKDKTKKKMAEGVRDEDPEEGTKKERNVLRRNVV